MSRFRDLANLLAPGIAKEAYHWLRSPAAYRDEMEFRRLKRAPRRVPMTMRLDGREIAVTDGPSAAAAAEAIFGPRQAFRFQADRPNPLIYDCGANVGVSVLYWKKLFPHSRVVAFEPDPQAFACLRANCAAYPDIELHEAALWTMQGSMTFASNGADGGCLAIYNRPEDAVATPAVATIRLRDMLTEPIDLLKMDIEGAEVDVLVDCADRLWQVQRLFVEYHSFAGRRQRLDELLEVLGEAGMRVCIDSSEHYVQRPFCEKHTYNGKDMHVNVFAVRV